MRKLLLALLLLPALAVPQEVAVLGTRGTLISLDAPETSSSATPTETPLRFTPAENKTYRVVGGFVMSTTLPSVAPRIGVFWPGGTIGGACALVSDRVVTLPHGTDGDSGTEAWISPANAHGLITFNCLFGMGGSPTGEFIVGIRSEVTGPETITLHQHSWIEFGITP